MFSERLNRSRNGRGILFCGAGFSASALNFSDQDIGATAHLLNLLNQKLKDAGHEYGFKDVRNAAELASKKFGEHGLLRLLVDRYQIKNVSADMVEICQHPWEQIYTTNYDNALELALSRAGKKHKSINNLDEVSALVDDVSNVIHIHGYVNSWDINNFDKSCILTAESYYKTSAIKNWFDNLRQDVDRSELVVFVGFNAADFHLNEILRDASALKEKIFFINRETAEPDVDIRMTQNRFGMPLYIGRQGLATVIRQVEQSIVAPEPTLSSFYRYDRKPPASSVPSTRSIEGLFLFGDTDQAQLARDADLSISDYHVRRRISETVLDALDKDIKVALISGEICDGKTLLLQEVSRKLNLIRPVFFLRVPYDDILDEVSKILSIYPNSVLVIENCFDIRRDRLVSIASRVNSSSAVLLLSSRSIAVEARPGDVDELRRLDHFREFRLPKLTDLEIDELIALSDQIAGWSEFEGHSIADRRQFVRATCGSSLPSFLLRLLRSEYVRGRYKEEFNKIEILSNSERYSIIVTLYISHIGERPTTGLLSDLFKLDMSALLVRLVEGPTALRLLRRKAHVIETVPSIGATNILKELVADGDIVTAVAEALRAMSSEGRQDQFRRHIFSQMMRYSILRTVVQDDDWITKFFDYISKIGYIRRQVLFWLQWSIALRERGAFSDAEKKLEQAYREAEIYERKRGSPFDRRQLDDVRAKFLLARAGATALGSAALFRDIKEASEIVGRLLRLDELTHHPFETLEGIVQLFLTKAPSLDGGLRGILDKLIRTLIEVAAKRIGGAPPGYQESMAMRALENAKHSMSLVSPAAG